MSGFYFQINEICESAQAPGSGQHGRPSLAAGAHVVVRQGASGMLWYCDGKQIYQVAQPPTGLFRYSAYSVFYREGFGFWILRGDAGNPGPEETWQPLCFDHDQHDQGASYLCNAAQRHAVLYRKDAPWLPMLLPDIYYENVQATSHEDYGGLKGELALFLALIAFSMRPEYLPGWLPVVLQNGSWSPHTLPHGRQDNRGVTVTIYALPGHSATFVQNYEKYTKYFK